MSARNARSHCLSGAEKSGFVCLDQIFSEDWIRETVNSGNIARRRGRSQPSEVDLKDHLSQGQSNSPAIISLY